MTYLRFPHVRGDQLVFVTDDDLWTVSANGGVARRLTAGLGDVSLPFLSPDGTQIACTSREGGHAEIRMMPAEGGPAKRLTWLVASDVAMLGWTADGKVLLGSNHGQPFHHMVHAYTVSADGGEPTLVNVGPCSHLSCGADAGAVLGRNTTDLGCWKRYRGGARGVMWIDTDYRIGAGTSNFTPFLHDLGAGDGKPPASVSTPMWVNGRVYFLSDHEGIGNLYSAALDGRDLQRHSDHADYTARYATTDGTRIVYQCGARIWRYTPGEHAAVEVKIECHNSRTQLIRKFVDASDNLDTAALHPEGHSVAITTRGKAYTMPLWAQAVRQHGKPHGVRYRHAQWLHDGSALVCVSDDGGEEALEIHPGDPLQEPTRLDGPDHGRVDAMTASPTSQYVAFTNQRFELILVDMEAKTAKTLLKSEHDRIAGFGWSPDGRWIAAGVPASPHTSNIQLVNVETGDINDVSAPDFVDRSPAWDPDGRFLYFISNRIHDPVHDGMFFELSLPRGSNLADDTAGRYREWVEANRRTVHMATGGKVGYIHVPDVGPDGYSEFLRNLRPQISRDALIVDVRFNGGGSASQLLLEKLRRRIVGYTIKRYGGRGTYPDMAPAGPIVALTNEYAGSGGDVFLHAFKLFRLGPLVGKRTWGGLIGAWPRHRLADGTITGQPEFSYWFEDVGWSVENYGTDPLHEVEVTPQDYASNTDPQLAKGLELVQQLLADSPSPPDFGNRPNLAAPQLPPRG